MTSLNDIYIATAVTNNDYKDIVKVMASSFVRHNPGLQLHVYCLNFDNAAYAAYQSSFDMLGVILHQIEYTNPYTDASATGKNHYRAILDSTSVKFKLLNDNTDKDYFMWIDADTVFCKPLNGIERYLKYAAVYGVPRTRFLPTSELTFNAGVLIFHKKLAEGILDKYLAYCQKVQAIDPRLLGWSDEHFIRDEIHEKGLLPPLYNATPNNYNKNAVIGHLVGRVCPWTIPAIAVKYLNMPHSAIKPLCDIWLAEYANAKHLLSADFIKKVEE